MRLLFCAAGACAVLVVAGCGGTTPTSATLVSTGTNTTLPTSWSGPLPVRSAGTRPVCQTDLPTAARCVNNASGVPQALCADGLFSCSTDSGTCSANGGVYCWRQ